MSDQIYVDPSITAPVIKVGGECYQKVGGVPVAPNVSSVQGTFDDCGGCAYVDPCVNAPTSLAILDYSDTYFSPCPDATPAVPGDCVWDGVFDYFDAQTCAYSNRYCFDGNGCFDCSYNGHRMWEFQPPGISSVWYNAASKTFFMQITGQNGQNSGEIVWQGSKTAGPGFSGTYNWTGGCDIRPTVEIA